MPIDWFTVIAQAINFLILLWLLKRFLYRPIIDGLDARESKIANILADANSKQNEALDLKSQYEEKLTTIEQQATQSIASAKKEADVTAKKILDDARESADILLKKRLEAMQQEILHSKQDLLQKSVHEVYAISRKVLTDLADSELEKMLFEKLLQHLNTLEEHQSEELKNALLASGNQILVRSVFSLSAEQLKRLQQCIQDKFATDKQQNIELNQSLVPQLITGIELMFNGWKISWSAQHYLTELQQQVEAVLDSAAPNNKVDEQVKTANKNT